METSRKRKFEKWAGIAYAAGFVISTLHDFYSEGGFFDNSSFFRMKPLQITLTHALVFAHAYFVSKGKAWAKVVMVVFLVYGAFRAIDGAGLPVFWETGALTIAHAFFQWTLNAAIFALLILSFRPSNLHQPE